ncbi:protein-L-isoaspartate O-methyltransferase [mine drainage metagenome]|uniref:protein-L-isoaspartate(D-aspartate) O-methyltransferase n=1 Tax=mine drainage metagenome TaxID=410659 RepID=A0A1J5R5X9_9ZZZZ
MRTGADQAADLEYQQRRDAMVEEIVEMAEEVAPACGGMHLSPGVLDAMSRVPRHRFVPEDERPYAYQNRPLAIGHNQTISQPYIVALMTDLLALEPGDRVLEVGTGSGYQTAVLAELGTEVYSIEIVEPIARNAAGLLQALGYGRVQTKVGDGYQGWPEHAPYDGVMVTAGASHVPQPLLDQLRPGGRMVIPVGEAFDVQELLLITKDEAGHAHRRQVIPVRFVPLTGGH